MLDPTADPAPPSLYDRCGGDLALRPAIEDFVATMLADPMIGFFFAKTDRQRLIDAETSLCANLLGAQAAYSGRPIRASHAPFAINGGQFMRRRTLLRQALERHGLLAEAVEAILHHTDRLRPLVTREAGSSCLAADDAAAALVVAVGADGCETVVRSAG